MVNFNGIKKLLHIGKSSRAETASTEREFVQSAEQTGPQPQGLNRKAPKPIKGEYSQTRSMEETDKLRRSLPQDLRSRFMVQVYEEEKGTTRRHGGFYTSLAGTAKFREYTLDRETGLVSGRKRVIETTSGLGEATVADQRFKDYPTIGIHEFIQRAGGIPTRFAAMCAATKSTPNARI